jgi:hypothetical protein
LVVKLATCPKFVRFRVWFGGSLVRNLFLLSRLCVASGFGTIRVLRGGQSRCGSFGGLELCFVLRGPGPSQLLAAYEAQEFMRCAIHQTRTCGSKWKSGGWKI